MAVFRVERNKGYTVMSNHHLRNKELQTDCRVRLCGFLEQNVRRVFICINCLLKCTKQDWTRPSDAQTGWRMERSR